MWNTRKDEETARNTPAVVPAVKETRSFETAKPASEYRAEVAHIGKSVLIKGELSGSEDLYLDGEVEGNVDLKGHGLTVGPHGRVRAHTQAREVVVHGTIDGNIHAERVELKKSSVVVGDIVTQRVMVEDGAYFKGAIEVQREQKVEPRREPALAAAAAAGASATSVGSSAQGSLLETKK